MGLPSNIDLRLEIQGSNLLAFTSSGFYISEDSGNSWLLRSILLRSAEDFVFLDTNFFMFGDSSIFRSTDSGRTWTNAGEGLSWIGQPPCFGTMGKVLLAGTCYGSIYRSTDAGRNWEHVDSNINYNGYSTCVSTLRAVGSILFAVTNCGYLLRSMDTGETWNPLDSLFYTDGPFALIDTEIFVGGGGVSLSTNNGKSWSSTSMGGGVAFVNMAVIDTNIFIIGGGLYLSTDNGESWKILSNPPSRYALFAKAIDSNLFVWDDDSIFRSKDGGKSWTPACAGHPRMHCETSGWGLSQEGTNLIAGTGVDGLFLSTNDGTSWSPINTGFPTVQTVCDTTGNFYRVRNLSNVAIMGTKLFTVVEDQGIYVSTNDGSNWSAAANNNLLDSLVGPLAVCNGNLFAGVDLHGIYKSTNNGDSWVNVNNGLAGNTCDDFLVIGNDIFASMQDSGIFLSTDGGKSWTFTGLAYGGGWGCFAIANNNLSILTLSHGIWRRPLSDFGISAVNEPRPPSAVTVRAWPNPFSQSTTIDFTARTAGYASVSIVNPLGTEVAHLFSGELSPGEHRFTWSNPSVPDGMYECVVRMNGQVQQAGVVLMR